jgi:hypothetical protein
MDLQANLREGLLHDQVSADFDPVDGAYLPTEALCKGS